MKNETKTIILTAFISIGLIAGGIVVLNNPSHNDINLTVQEWRCLYDVIYNEELKIGVSIDGKITKENILDKTDEKVLENVQAKSQDERNIVEGLLIKRNSANKNIISNLRKK